MRSFIYFALFLFFVFSCSEKKIQTKDDFIIADGQMPAIAKDNNNTLHVVFGIGDSIMYTCSSDKGHTFSKPVLITKLPHVYTFAMRGPQIAASGNKIIVTACTADGNIYSYYKENGDAWEQGKRINDADTVCKEGLMALNADGSNAFAVWLDLRGNSRNKIYGAKSIDGGKTWSENKMIYTSPDTTVCECCRPSVVVWKNKVAIMFRNWLDGNRDLYLVQSGDTGDTFGKAQKLGTGSWKLNGCPMDGGNLVVNNNGEVQTVWRRQATIYFDKPGIPEKEIGKGKGCTIETINDKNIYAWSESGKIVVMKAGGEKKLIGEGNLPVLKDIDGEHFLCVWENNKQIHAFVLK